MKYGFVYIWYDRKHKRYYIGSHWGTEDDGYVCSSTWMKNSFKRRPQDFKRRILETNIEDRNSLYERETAWLALTKPEEIGRRYYNLATGSTAHWSAKPNAKSIGQKISASKTGKKRTPFSDETKTKMSISKTGNRNGMFGVSRDDDVRKRISEALKGRPKSEETKRKISESKRKNKI